MLELVSLPLDKLVAVDVVVMTFLDSLWFMIFVVIKKLVIFPANLDKFVALDDVMIVDFFLDSLRFRILVAIKKVVIVEW